MDGKDLFGSHSALILGADGLPLLRSAGCNGLQIERKEIPVKAECGPQYSGMPVVIASSFGTGRRWYRCNGQTREIPMVAPGVDFYGSTYERDYGRWDCAPGGQTVCLRISSFAVARYFHDDADQFDLENKYSTKDDWLVQALYAFADEMQNRMPNGLLYAEGLAMTIIGWLRKHHSIELTGESCYKNKLTQLQKERVRQFVDTYLGADLSVEKLASQVNTSPFHFLRLFKASFGMTPHRYVLQARVARAAALLRQARDKSIAEVAVTVGFSNQAHLTHAFKTHMGQTPALWRKT